MLVLYYTSAHFEAADVTSFYRHDVDQLRKFMAQLPDIDDSVSPVDSGGHETTGNTRKLTLGIYSCMHIAA